MKGIIFFLFDGFKIKEEYLMLFRDMVIFEIIDIDILIKLCLK